MSSSPLQTDVRPDVAELEDLAFDLRRKLLHLCGTYEGAVHIGGDLSAADIFTALFHYGLRVDPSDLANPDRDRFVLSKGHAAVCMCIAMAMRGFFSYDGIVAGAFAGFAGGLGAFFTPYVSQDTYPPMLSFGYVIMAVVGGLGSLWGGVVGVVAVSVWLQLLGALSATPGLPPTAGPVLQYAGYGAVLVVVLLVLPRGIVPSAVSGWNRWRGRRASVAASASGDADAVSGDEAPSAPAGAIQGKRDGRQ